MLIGEKETAYGQSSIPDSCICYTENQDKRCLECLINQPKKNQLIKNKELEIEQLEIEISEYKKQKLINEERVKELGENLSKTKKRLNFSLKLNKFGIPIALGSGFIVGMILK